MTKEIILGGGCFWCTEAVFSIIKGVISTEPGYAGGETENPTYEMVCTGETGHAEVVRVKYDEGMIPLTKILDVFFNMHDPTSLNRQGNDVGEQYRSAIFYLDEQDGKIIRDYIKTAQTRYHKNIVTQVEELKEFYPGEEYHKNYFKRNPYKSYCTYVIKPKVEKVENGNPELFLKI